MSGQESSRTIEDRLDALEIAMAVLKSRVLWGFAVLGALQASPKLGGPEFNEALVYVISRIT